MQDIDSSQHPQIIYILGNSHSGSTLLGFLLSGHAEIVFLGELKTQTWLKERFCSCDNSVMSCPFYKNFLPTMNEVKKEAFRKTRYVNPMKFLFRNHVKLDTNTRSQFQQLYTLLCGQVEKHFPNVTHLVDSSKSIWMLNAWLQSIPHEKVKIIWIKRNIKANVASFVKRGSPFFSSLMSVIFNHWLIRIYLRRNKLEHLPVSYDRFYNAYEEEAQNIFTFLGKSSAPYNPVTNNHHVISGNQLTRRAFTYKFEGIHKDEEWKTILSGLQKKILSWID